MTDNENFLEKVRLGNLLKLRNKKLYVNEDMLSLLERNGYKLPNVERYPITDYGAENLVYKNKLLDLDYVNQFVYVHELQNAYADQYNDEIFA